LPRSFFGGEHTYSELSQAVSSPDPSVRWASLLELGGRTEPWARELILSCLTDSDANVARTAHEELGLEFTNREPLDRKTVQSVSSKLNFDFSETFETALSAIDWSTQSSPIALELYLRKIAHDSSHLVSDTTNPFPQADRFERVLQVVNFLGTGHDEIQTLVNVLDIDERQVHYYLAASRYLGLVFESDGKLAIPSEVQKLFNEVEVTPLEFFFEVAKSIVRIPSIASTFLEWNSQSPSIDRQISLEALRNSDAGSSLSESTLARRARTVYSWAWWVRKNLNVMQEYWASNEFFRQPPLPNFERALSAVERLGEREVGCLCRNNTLFVSRSSKTLDEVGREFGISRERVRQIEKDIVERIWDDIERETKWDWKADLLSHLGENLVFDSANLIFEISPDKFGEAISNTLLSRLGCSQVGKSKRFWTLDEAQLRDQIEFLKSITPLTTDEWTERIYESGLNAEFLLQEIEEFRIIDSIVIDSKRRREQIVEFHLSRHGTADEQVLAALCGEPPSRAFAEALRRNRLFTKNHISGHWQLADSVEETKTNNFSSVYGAVIHLLESHGPMKMSDLQNYMEDTYPVSSARVSQALDHFQIGRLDDGRVALISQGGSRPDDKEPKKPGNGLWFEDSEIFVHKNVDEDVFRGSGFLLPRWLQWRFGLKATPEFATFAQSGNSEKDFVVSRRGGQTFGSSIKESLRPNNIEKGCTVAIVLNPETMTWRLLHKHGTCH
jgi:hypothetical protein